MPNTLVAIFYTAALLCFAAAAFGIPRRTGAVGNMVALGLACWVAPHVWNAWEAVA